MSNFYIIRHGQTQYNREKRKQGWSDSPLTLKGVNQVINLSNHLKKHLKGKEYSIFVSPLARTKQTASILCDTLEYDYSNCVFLNDLREHSFGIWEGMTEEEIENEFPGELQKRENDRWNYLIPGGESYKLLNDRVLPILNAKYPTEDIVFVTHGMVSNILRGELLNLSKIATMDLFHSQDTIYKLSDK